MKKLLLLICLGLTLPMLSHAGNKPGTTTFTINGNAFIFSPKRNFQNTVEPSVALAYNFSQQFAGEASIALMHVNGKNSATRDAQGYLYSIDGIYRTPIYRCLEPYFIAGVGDMGLKPAKQTETVHQTNIHAGIGAQWFKHPMVALRSEVRDIYTFSGGKNDVVVSFGVSFLFGCC